MSVVSISSGGNCWKFQAEGSFLVICQEKDRLLQLADLDISDMYCPSKSNATSIPSSNFCG